MARTSIWQPKLHRDDEFVVAKSFKINGEELIPGTDFNKTSVTQRTLRLLYESRKIALSKKNGHGEETSHVHLNSNPALKHMGGGKWAVVRNGLRLTPLLTKALAQSELENLNGSG